MRKTVLIAMVAFGLAVAGCGKEHVSKQEAEDGWKTTNQTLTQGMAEVSTASVSGSSSDSGATVTVEFTCPEGGSAQFKGSYEDTGSSGSAISANAELLVDYNACTASGTTIDGSLDYTTTVTGDDSSATVTLDWQGKLTWTGEVNGVCKIDMTGETSASGSSFSYSYSGSICGYDASKRLNSFSFDF